ncbi:MAG: pyruvate carboxylase, partial [Flaviaesturariibacter sp.]|nr:pyruvate carboxylase [Flaviaesturariibacter sp.]
LVTNNLTIDDVRKRGHSLSFPESVVSLFKGDIGQPVGGFDPELQTMILKGVKPYTERPNEHLKPIDFDTEMSVFREKFGESVTETDLLSWLLYPKVFEEFMARRKEYGDVTPIPTLNFFYGLRNDEEVLIEIDKGKSILVRLLTCTEPDEEGKRKVFMRLNGQTRIIEVQDANSKAVAHENEKAEKSNSSHVGAPLQGKLSQLLIKEGDAVSPNQPLFVIEAMKMETTITATKPGTVRRVVLKPGQMVRAEDLVLELD